MNLFLVVEVGVDEVELTAPVDSLVVPPLYEVVYQVLVTAAGEHSCEDDVAPMLTLHDGSQLQACHMLLTKRTF